MSRGKHGIKHKLNMYMVYRRSTGLCSRFGAVWLQAMEHSHVVLGVHRY